MKFFVSLLFIAIVGTCVYLTVSRIANRKAKQKQKKSNRKAMQLTAAVVVSLLALLAFVMIKDAAAPDMQCSAIHAVTYPPPAALKTATDYFLRGNYDYDTGSCQLAIVDYTQSIRLDRVYPQAYNNRAYTYMRLRDYRDALADLDKAIELNPNYIQALMNRGDIHNYYFEIDRKKAIADYEKVISLGGTDGTSVCGHIFLARHNGWNLGTILDFSSAIFNKCN